MREGIKVDRPYDWGFAWRVLGAGLLIGVLAWGCIVLTESTGHVASIWLGNAVLLAVMLRTTADHWPPYLLSGVLGVWVANLITGSGWLVAGGLALINGFEVLVAAYPLRFLMGPKFSVTKARGFAGFFAIAVIFAPSASGLLASAFLNVTEGAPFIDVLTVWLPADALGMAMVAPALLAVGRRELRELVAKSGVLRTAGILAILLFVTLLVFTGSDPRISFVIFLPLVVAVLQFGFAGGSLALFVIGGVALYQSIQGMGPFAFTNGISRDEILLLQSFLACTLLVALPLAVIMDNGRRLRIDLERANRKLAEIATTDPLTGLANRRLLDRTLMIEWRRAQRTGRPLSLLVIDVDSFKAYNDLYGHPAGDRCLVLIADLCNTCLRRPGDLLARFGGEEFVAVLPDTPAEGAAHVAERMRLTVELAQIEHRLDANNQVTVSVGTATMSDGRPESGQDLLSLADRALYAAKTGGRNRVVSDPPPGPAGSAPEAPTPEPPSPAPSSPAPSSPERQRRQVAE